MKTRKVRVSAGADTETIRAELEVLAGTLADFLAQQSKRVALAVAAAYRKENRDTAKVFVAAAKLAARAGGTVFKADDQVGRVLRQIELDWEDLVDRLIPSLRAVYGNAGAAALDTLGSSGFDALNTEALNYARERAAEMVGMRWSGGELVPNPNAEWAITDSTRDGLRAQVERAFEDGLSPGELAARIRDSYDFSAQRAEMVARTELASAHVEGSLEAWRESGVVSGKRWILGSEHGGEDDCDLNAAAGVIGINETFPSGDEAPPLHPNCLTGDAVVAAGGRIAAQFKRRFEGEIVRLRVEGVKDLTITPNHPVLTDHGWVAAGELQKGDRLVYCPRPAAAVARLNPRDHQMPAPIEQVARALRMTRGMTTRTVPVAPEDFHGDASADGEVEVVRPDGDLSAHREPRLRERVEHRFLRLREGGRTLLSPGGALAELLKRGLAAAAGIVRGLYDSLAFRVVVARPGHTLAVAHGADGQAGPVERIADRGAMAPDLPREIHRRLAGLVATVEVREVSREYFAGQVYNLSTVDRFYLANGLIVHNCVCDLTAELAAS